MEKMLTYNDVENIIKERGDCGIHGDKLRKIIDFFNYNIENKNFMEEFSKFIIDAIFIVGFGCFIFKLCKSGFSN